jgi:hypothetical protein
MRHLNTDGHSRRIQISREAGLANQTITATPHAPPRRAAHPLHRKAGHWSHTVSLRPDVQRVRPNVVSDNDFLGGSDAGFRTAVNLEDILKQRLSIDSGRWGGPLWFFVVPAHPTSWDLNSGVQMLSITM